MPRSYNYLIARDSTVLYITLSHPLNVRVDQFASQSTVHSIALFVFYVNNVMSRLIPNRGRKCLLFVKIELTCVVLCAILEVV